MDSIESYTRIVGLDCSMRRSGWSLLMGDHQTASIIDSGVFYCPQKNHGLALYDLYSSLQRVLERTQPDIVYIEEQGRIKYDRSKTMEASFALTKAVGVAEAACASLSIPYEEIKQESVKKFLGIQKQPGSPDRMWAKYAMAEVLRLLSEGKKLLHYSVPIKKNGEIDYDINDAIGISLSGFTNEYIKGLS